MIVIKMGGASGIDPEPLLQELAALDEPWILVHGGNQELDEVSRKMGVEPRFVSSPSGHMSRVTNDETVNLIRMVYRGAINGRLVHRLQQLDCNAVGLSGVDGKLWQATRKNAIRVIEDGKKFLLRDDLTGKIHTINTHLLSTLMDGGYHPVVTLPALADTGEAVNVDGDRASAAMAGAVGAHTLVILSNVPGLLRDPDDHATLIAHIQKSELADNEQYAKGRFRKKLLGVQEALDGGVKRVVLATTDSATPLADALAGIGTVIE